MGNCENCANFGTGGCQIRLTTGMVWDCNFIQKYSYSYTTTNHTEVVESKKED